MASNINPVVAADLKGIVAKKLADPYDRSSPAGTQRSRRQTTSVSPG